MNSAASSSALQGPSPRQLLSNAIQTNQAHQYALTKYAERLTEELKEKAADAEQHEDDAVDEDIQIFGATTAKSPINAVDLLKSESPFYEEAKARQVYTTYTHSRPMKARELEVLTDAVTDEFRRLRAVEHRESGLGIPNRSDPVDMNGDTKDVNWKVVAEKVSDVATFKRTPEECKVKWVSHKQPRLNHAEWDESEIKRLHEIVKDRQAQGRVDWVEVAQALGTNRVPIDCMRNAISRPRHAWDQESDKKLLEAVKLYGQNNWDLCALYVSEHCTASQCQSRFNRTIDPQIKRSEWTADEDAKLLAAVATYGPSWMEISSFLPGRTNDQCRERHQAALNNVPGRRGGLWDAEEDRKLLEAVSVCGHKWKLVSAHMEHTRSEGQCRTRYAKIQKGLASNSTSREASSVPSAPAPQGVPVPLQSDAAASSVVTPSGAVSTSQESRPKPRRESAKAKGKGKAKETPGLTQEPPVADSPSAPVAMDVDAPTATINTSGAPRHRPKPKPVKKSTMTAATISSSGGTEGTSADGADTGGDDGDTPQTPTMVAGNSKPTTPDAQTSGHIVDEDAPDEPMEDQEIAPPPTRKRGRSRKDNASEASTSAPKKSQPGSRQSRRLAEKVTGTNA